MGEKLIFLRSSIAVLLIFLFPQIAQAITVKTVPWVASNPLIPHDSWSGHAVTLKGTADVQGANIQYTWDFGDGSPVVSGTVTDRYNISLKHAYTGLPGDVFTARLSVEDISTGETASNTYFVQIRERNLETEVNVSIDEGLWYLHKFQTRYVSGGLEFGDWRARSGCNSCAGDYSITAANINAFEVNGHVESGLESNPYTETVARGMRRVFAYLTTETISNRTYPAPTGTVNPDSNGNGYGVRVNQSQYVYQGGMFMDVIIASGTPDAVTTTGSAASGSNPGIIGRSYASIVQDMVDSYAHGQYNGNAANRGGWTYGWNQARLDNSVSQWAAIGMIPAERNWGLIVPDWVKTENENALNYSQSGDGRFGYDRSNYFPWGPFATTPSGMVQMVMDGIGRGDARWDNSETYIRNNFANGGSATSAIKNYYYGLFSFVKSMRLHIPSITLLGGDYDWYNAEVSQGDFTDGVARTLVGDQHSDGYWRGHNYYGAQYPFESAWSILMLGQTLFESGSPVAVAQALPNPGVSGQVITLDGGASFHQDTAKQIDSWEWDFDNDGSFDASGAQVSTSYLVVGDYPVTLRITDNGNPEKSDTTVVTVRITVPPIAPTSDAGGPYVFCPGIPMFLDGTNSNNPDEGQSEIGQVGDTIQSYGWDLNGNGDFSDALLAQPDVTAYFTAAGVGDYLVRLRVTDTTASSYPSSGMGDLSDTDSAQVRVKDASDISCTCLSDLYARPKSGKVQLVWTDTGVHHYNVYRGLTPGGPYTFLASTESRYSTYLDSTVSNETQYFYAVRTAEANGSETCQSVEVNATPTASRRSRNLAPVITSTAISSAVEGMLYAYDVDAIDAENGVLAYSLDSAPAGMNIDIATGLIGWSPLNAQVGEHTVVVRVTDPLGVSTTQTYILVVSNANRAPQFVSLPVTEAIAGMSYSYDAEAIDLDVGDSLVFALTTAPAGMTIDPSSGIIDWTPANAQIGFHDVTVEVADNSELSASQSYQISVIEPNLPPTITSTPITTAIEGFLYNYDVDAVDPNVGDVLTYSLMTPPAGMTIDATSGLISWVPDNSQTGDIVIMADVMDSGGLSVIQTFTVRVAYFNDPPVITSTAVTTATEGILYQYDVNASDADLAAGDVLTFGLDFAPAGMSINASSGLIDWQPGETQVGTQNVTVRVSDAQGAFATQQFDIDVINQPDVPSIISSPILNTTEASLYSYDVNATDPDAGDVLTYSLTIAPAGMSIDATSGLIQWTADNAQVGDHAVTVLVTDSTGLSDTQSFVITVLNINQAPVINSSANLAATEGLLYQYPVLASDPDLGDILTFSLDLAPAGMSVDAVSGLIEWTAAENQIGDHSVTVRVADVAGLFDTQSFIVTVANELDVPVITSSPVTSTSEGASYSYPVVASDTDVADSLSYGLDSAPAGMQIDVDTGLIQWNPTEADIGSHLINIRVTDSTGLFVVQSYTLDVANVEHAPQITSAPVTTATADIVYNYEVNASDADSGDVITYSLDTAPAGMTIDAASGLISWTPGIGQLGLNSVTVRASDGGLSSTQSFTVGVTDIPNTAPSITSTPAGPAMALQLWVYQVSFSDPDSGDTHTVSLTTAPSGMSMDGSGLVSWTPTDAQQGSHPVTVRVEDNRGGFSTQSFSLTVNPSIPPQPPEITSTPVVSAVVGQVYVYDVDATDANGDAIVYSLPTAPEGMTIDASSGVITWTPTNAQIGVNAVSVRSADASGFQTQSFNISVSDTAIPLEVFVQATPDIIDQGATVTVEAWTTGGSGPINLTLSVNGIPTALDGSGNAIVTGDTIGGFELVATAMDSIETISATNFFSVRDPADTTPPTVDIISPVADAVITEPVDIIGTVQDSNLVKYQLLISEAGKSDYSELSLSTSAIVNGVLGQLDPGKFINGIYDIALVATDANGQQSSVVRTYQISGDQKVGNFTISFNDFVLPMAGVPIVITRTYDSRVKTQKDFGYGWFMTVKQGKYQNNRKPGDGWRFTSRGGFLDLPCWFSTETSNHVTEIRLSETEVYRFKASITNPAMLSGGCVGTASFVPLVGNLTASLQILGSTSVWANNNSSSNQVLDFDPGSPDFLETYDPQRVRLTTPDGRQFVLSSSNGIESIRDINGNGINITNAGISHTSGAAISFERDAQGRITRITPPSGAFLEYRYGVLGDLTQVVDAEGNISSFGYARDHFLTDITDARGVPMVRNEYDNDGLLIATTDAAGNTTEFEHDELANREVYRNRLGFTTIYEYDAEGNITSRTDESGNTWTYSFDSQGNKTQEVDALGNVTLWSFDADGNQLSKTDALGNTESATFNSAGSPLTQTDKLGNVTTHVFDSKQNLSSVTDPLGNVASYTHDTGGNILIGTDPRGFVTSRSYTSEGQEATTTDALGNVTSFTYDADGNQLNETRTRTVAGVVENEIIEYSYDLEGRQTSRVDALGNTISSEYDPIGQISAVVDRRGNRREMEYDFQGKLTRVLYADGTSTLNEYDAEGRKTATIDRAGRRTEFTLNATGNILLTTFPDGSSTGASYDALKRKISETDENGNVTNFVYDAVGNLTRRIDALGNITDYTYDANGNRLSEVDANGNTTQWQYDANGNRTRTTYQNGSFTTATYDSVNNKISETDQAGITTGYEYDGLNQLVRIIDALGGVTQYAYDEAGNRTSITDANGQVTQYEYDAEGRQTRTIKPMGQVLLKAYDAQGNIVQMTDANGDVINDSFDTENRVARRDYPDGNSVFYVYTPTGQVASVTDSRGVTGYSYDSRDRLVRTDLPDGSFIAYTYDGVGNILSIATAAGVTQYAFDALNRLTNVTDQDGGITSYTYDAVGNRSSLTLPNGTITSYTYDTLNRLTELLNRRSDLSVISSYTYTLGAIGNRTRVDEIGRTVNYTYDSLYRLTQESITDGLVTTDVDYSYDAVGNRISKTVDIFTVNYTYDANDRLFSEGAISYNYDANGNTISKTDGSVITTYSYDFENRLTTTSTGASVVGYAYDSSGNRVSRTIDGITTRFLVDANRPLAQVMEERDSVGALVVRYTHGDDLISQNRAGLSSYYHYDGLGSTRLLSNSAAVITDNYTYDAFGDEINRTGTTANEYMFTGQQYDVNIGFYYLRARYYNPRSGRFITEDTFPADLFDPQSLHRYVYVTNNPVNMVDPTGNFGTLGGMMTAVSIGQMMSVMAPTIITASIITVGIQVFWKPGFALRNMGIMALTMQLPNEEAYEEAMRLYTNGAKLIQLGAFFIEQTNNIATILQFGWGIKGLAQSFANIPRASLTVVQVTRIQRFVGVSVRVETRGVSLIARASSYTEITMVRVLQKSFSDWSQAIYNLTNTLAGMPGFLSSIGAYP